MGRGESKRSWKVTEEGKKNGKKKEEKWKQEEWKEVSVRGVGR